MGGSVQPAEEQKAPLRPFLLYFLRLGTFGFGGPIALASRMESELVQERGWIQRGDYLEVIVAGSRIGGLLLYSSVGSR